MSPDKFKLNGKIIKEARRGVKGKSRGNAEAFLVIDLFYYLIYFLMSKKGLQKG
jgi:hypothetical protein